MQVLFKMLNRGVFAEINGVVSTGKEANVYHATAPSGAHLAVKVYKTSILVFKDRERCAVTAPQHSPPPKQLMPNPPRPPRCRMAATPCGTRIAGQQGSMQCICVWPLQYLIHECTPTRGPGPVGEANIGKGTCPVAVQASQVALPGCVE